MKALVTGGAGFIGSHIVERLLKDGHSVVVLDNFSSGRPENLSFVSGGSKSADLINWCHNDTNNSSETCDFVTWHHGGFMLIRGDIRGYSTCLKACRGVDVIFHEAALRSVPKSMKAPHDYNDVNIDGILNMLEAARENKVRRFVFASSSSVYGDPGTFPEKEDFYPMLISPYALSKLAGEYYCRIFHENFGVECVSLRYFNVYGPRQALDDEYAVVVPKFIHCILNDEPPPIFGNGLQSRDFTYIDNVVEANILAATAPLTSQGRNVTKSPGVSGALRNAHDTQYPAPNTQYPTPHTLVFNIANGSDNTVLHLVDVLNKIIGKDIKPKLLPVRAGDVFKTHADISKARKYLGYEPKVDFEEGLSRTVEYFRKLNLTQGF